MFFNPFPNAIGLDINDLSIKVVQLRNISHRKSGPSYELVTARKTELPHGLIMDGILQQPEKVRKYIIHLLSQQSKKHKAIRVPWVVASVPDAQGFIKLIQLDKDSDDIIEEDVLFAAKKHVPFSEDEYYIDWQIMPKPDQNEKYTKILIGTIPKNIADMYTYLLESLGMAVIALEIGSLATARAMITHNKKYVGEARAILDIGATKSDLIIYDHGHIQFGRTLAYSGEIITTAIMQKRHISYEEAEAQKKKYGLEYKESKIWHIITAFTNDLVQQIQETINFYYSHFPDTNKITHITMCGGGSLLKKLDKILSLKLKVPTEPGRVWKNLYQSKPIPANMEKSMHFATAIGLALRAADNPFFTKDII